VLVALIAWPVGLVLWANGKVQHVDALSGAANTPGTTYLLTGSDSRADGAIEDTETVGARTDTILLLHVPESGPTALISLPRDTYTKIPGYNASKLNAAYSWGGAPLLVQTVEGLTGLTIDHYVEVGFGGVEQVVDAVGGVELCLDGSTGITFPVNDEKSGLTWAAPGCETADGARALAFSRMRYSDPSGDIGRGMRQRQLISAVASKAANPALLFQPGKQISLIDSGTGALTASDGTGIVDLGKLALAFRAATGPDGITGTPPIASLDYRPGNVGSTVLLDEAQLPTFFQQIRDGSLPPGVVGGVPTP
jgi:LCP family protein required for cell wall assembly